MAVNPNQKKDHKEWKSKLFTYGCSVCKVTGQTLRRNGKGYLCETHYAELKMLEIIVPAREVK